MRNTEKARLHCSYVLPPFHFDDNFRQLDRLAGLAGFELLYLLILNVLDDCGSTGTSCQKLCQYRKKNKLISILHIDPLENNTYAHAQTIANNNDCLVTFV